MQNLYKVGFGGGCHWCTEAVFMSLRGVTKVAQGFISPKENIEDFLRLLSYISIRIL